MFSHYRQFDSDERSASVESIYSLQEGVVIIGNDLNEWLDDREAFVAFMRAGGSSKMDITVQNLKAYCEGTVGWTMDRVTVKLPNGVELPVRHTRIFHKENGAWKMVHLRVSIPVPNDKLGELQIQQFIEIDRD